MANNFLYIVWNVDPNLINIGGFEIRYYGVAWALTFLIGMVMFRNFVRRERLDEKVLDSVIVYGALGTIIGARLGHCLLYDPGYYLSHPLEIITGIRDGGLASHGAAIGLLVGLWLMSRRRKLPYLWGLDRIMLPVTVGGAIVRLGNLMNSEIYGIETGLPWGFIFVRAGETVPKHPTQIYEALCYLITFALLMWLYYKRDAGRRRPGLIFGVGLIGVFLSRFFIEFIKNPQEAFEEGMALDMGQWLSIPFVITGIIMVVWACRRPQAVAGRLPDGRSGKNAAGGTSPKNASAGKNVGNRVTEKTSPQSASRKAAASKGHAGKRKK